MKNYLKFILLSAIAASTSCTLTPTTTTLLFPTQPTVVIYKAQSWQQRYHALRQYLLWNINGTFSIQQPGKTIIAEYKWQQKKSNYHIRIYSILGIYSIEIYGRPGIIMLSSSSQKYYTTLTLEKLLQKQLGWKFPVLNLYYWVRGIPAPGIYHSNFDSSGHLIFLQQNGWKIHFSRYSRINFIDLPHTLILDKKPFTVKIIIKSWQLY